MKRSMTSVRSFAPAFLAAAFAAVLLVCVSVGAKAASPGNFAPGPETASGDFLVKKSEASGEIETLSPDGIGGKSPLDFDGLIGSPYCHNDPVNKVDYLGLETIVTNDQKRIIEAFFGAANVTFEPFGDRFKVNVSSAGFAALNDYVARTNGSKQFAQRLKSSVLDVGYRQTLEDVQFGRLGTRIGPPTPVTKLAPRLLPNSHLRRGHVYIASPEDAIDSLLVVSGTGLYDGQPYYTTDYSNTWSGAIGEALPLYAETLIAGALILNPVPGDEALVTIYRVQPRGPVSGGIFRHYRTREPIGKAARRWHKAVGQVYSNNPATRVKALQAAQASRKNSPFISTTFDEAIAKENLAELRALGVDAELITIQGPRSGGLDFEAVFEALGGRTNPRRFNDAVMREFGIPELSIPAQGKSPLGFRIIVRE